MANKYRGEIDASLDGAPYRLCLTLGALAELEGAFGSDDMLSLANRFAGGRISANDCVRILGAGLRGAGHDVADDAVARMKSETGAAGFVDIVARLLAATFGGPIPATAIAATALAASVPDPTPNRFEVVETPPPRPFRGPR
jgi:Phage tail tube protein, GTA-gp10